MVNINSSLPDAGAVSQVPMVMQVAEGAIEALINYSLHASPAIDAKLIQLKLQ